MSSNHQSLILRRNFLKQLGWFTVGTLAVCRLRNGNAEQLYITNESKSISNKADQNWHNFWRHHLRDWHGIWTRYAPDGEIIESFQSIRSFQGNSELTEIVQQNSYTYTDGSTVERRWEFSQQANSLPDGFSHPASIFMRGFCFEEGAAAWLLPQLQPGPSAIMELFLKHKDVRHSVGVLYDKSGNLLRTASIREDAAGFPSQYWSTQLQLLTERTLNGSWQGSAVTMTPNLTVSTPVPTQLQWGWDDHKTYYYPDGITLSCPDKLKMGTPFVIAINWLVNATHLQQMVVAYDEAGALSSVTLELLQRSGESGVTKL